VTLGKVVTQRGCCNPTLAHRVADYYRAVLNRLCMHRLNEVGTHDATGIAGMVAGPGDRAGATVPSIDDNCPQMESREINRRRQPAGPPPMTRASH